MLVVSIGARASECCVLTGRSCQPTVDTFLAALLSGGETAVRTGRALLRLNRERGSLKREKSPGKVQKLKRVASLKSTNDYATALSSRPHVRYEQDTSVNIKFRSLFQMYNFLLM